MTFKKFDQSDEETRHDRPIERQWQRHCENTLKHPKDMWPSSNWSYLWQLRTTILTFSVTLQLMIMTRDSIHNCCDVWYYWINCALFWRLELKFTLPEPPLLRPRPTDTYLSLERLIILSWYLMGQTASRYHICFLMSIPFEWMVDGLKVMGEHELVPKLKARLN